MQTTYEYVNEAGEHRRLTPKDDMVLIRRNPEPEYEGLLALPDSIDKPIERPVPGTVLATGPGKRLEDGRRALMPVCPGDTVLINNLVGFEVDIDGHALYMVEAEGIMGLITVVEE